MISRRLAALEARLGLCLLQRTTRRMHLTQEGELYAQRGQALLDELYALEADGLPAIWRRAGCCG